MANRFGQFDWPVDGFQFAFFMDQGARFPADRTGLWSFHSLRLCESQPFGRDLRHRSAQLMPSQFHFREPNIFLLQFSHGDFKPIGKAYKRLPFLFTDLRTGHFVLP